MSPESERLFVDAMRLLGPCQQLGSREVLVVRRALLAGPEDLAAEVRLALADGPEGRGAFERLAAIATAGGSDGFAVLDFLSAAPSAEKPNGPSGST